MSTYDRVERLKAFCEGIAAPSSLWPVLSARLRLGHCCLTINEPKMNSQVYFSGGVKEVLP